MIQPDQYSQVDKLLKRSQQVLVLLGNKMSTDQLAAASGLASAFRQFGKEVTLAAPQEPSATQRQLLSLDGFTTTLGNQNLVISFDYEETAVEKVSYHIGEETNKFFLTIKPQSGKQPLDKDTVEVTYAGVAADLIFLIGVHDLQQLDQLYDADEQAFTETPTITIHTFEPPLGTVKLDVSGAAAVSEAVTSLIRHMSLEVDINGASDLLVGVESMTDHLSSLSTTADTLESAAWLMRQGARRRSHKLSTKADISVDVDAEKDKDGVRVDEHKTGQDEVFGGLDHQPSPSAVSGK